MSFEGAFPKIGLVGTGTIGSALARHVLASGRAVVGWDRSREACKRFAAVGGTVALNLAEFAGLPLVISIVFDDDATSEVALGADGLVGLMAPGAIHVAMESISPSLSRRLSEAHASKGQRYMAASLFGRPEAAAAAEIMMNCSGASAVFEEVRPVLELFGKPLWVGPDPEQAMLVKTMGNNMIYTAIGALREMFDLLQAGGIDKVTAKRVLVDRLFPGLIYQGYAQRLIDDGMPKGPHAMATKDNQICLDAGEALGVKLPIVQFLHDELLPKGMI